MRMRLLESPAPGSMNAVAKLRRAAVKPEEERMLPGMLMDARALPYGVYENVRVAYLAAPDSAGGQADAQLDHAFQNRPHVVLHLEWRRYVADYAQVFRIGKERGASLKRLSYYTLIVSEPEGPTGISEDDVASAALQYIEIGTLPKVIMDDAP